MRDLPAFRLVLTILLVLCGGQVVGSCTARASEPSEVSASTSNYTPGIVPGDYCQRRDVSRQRGSKEQRARARARALGAIESLGASPLVLAYHRVVISRESSGDAGVRHLLGEDVRGSEDGLGLHGLSLRWHAGKWPGDDDDPAFCTPEVSALVAHDVVRNAVLRYGARNLVEVQAVYAGAVRCHEGECFFRLALDRRRNLCARLQGLGHDCRAPLTREDLGRQVPKRERRAWALSRARRAVAAWLGREGDAGQGPTS